MSATVALSGLSFADLSRRLGSPARAKAALRWMYDHATPDELPASVPGISQVAWTRLRREARMPGWRVVREQAAPDGTRKLALGFGDAAVETVLIPGPHRSTVCVSSQAGCTRHCAFCATASLGFTRNLSAAEMVAQYLLAQRLAPEGKPARNVVFMGMGEPLDNLGPVIEAVDLLVQAPYPALSPAHVTVSTSGVVPALRRFLKESPACLALSLNATTDEVRERIMPHNRLWPIATLLDAVRENALGREVFVEYVLFEGLNDSDADADRLPGLLEGIAARINVIPFNGHERGAFRAPSDEGVVAFQRRVAASGLRCLVRCRAGGRSTRPAASSR